MSQATTTGHQAIPAPRGVRNRATRIVASTVGVYGGLLGMEHGYFETLHRNSTASVPTSARMTSAAKALRRRSASGRKHWVFRSIFW